MKCLLFLIWISFNVCPSGHAATFKCIDQAENVVYTDQPCINPKSSKQISIVDNTSDSTEVRNRINNGRNQRPLTTGEMEEKVSGNSAIGIGPSRSDRDCFDARRSYEIEVSSIRKDLKAMGEKYRYAKKQCGSDLQMLAEHARLEAVESRKNSRRDATALKPPPPVNKGNLYIPKGNGYISPGGEFCTAVNDGAMCPTGGYVRIYRN